MSGLTNGTRYTCKVNTTSTAGTGPWSAASNAVIPKPGGSAKNDLDGDGKSDLIWYNAATGTTGAWIMNGAGMVSYASLFTDPEWKVVAAGDLDGDGKSDLIWYHASTGTTGAWLMNGTGMVAYVGLYTDPDWKVIGY